MIRRAPTLAALLALAVASVFPAPANAMPFLCRVADAVLSDMDNAPQAGYSYWIMYWLDNCES